MSEASAQPEMRRVFADTLVELGERDERIVVLDNDVGLTTLSERFRERFPERYVDIGIGEKNLFGTAAGLATAGYIPFPTTFAAFVVRCAMDQVSISIAYPGLDVKIPGHYIGGSRAGASHIAVEDLALMRAIPGMAVADPVDATELRLVMEAALARPGPVYFRVPKLAVPTVTDASHRFAWGVGAVLRTGRDVSLFATGIMTTIALRAAELLAGRGIDAEVVHLASVKPIDADVIEASVRRTGCAVTAELASINGGLGSAVAETVAERCPVPVRRIGYRDAWVHSAGIDEILDHHHLRPADIADAAMDAVGRSPAGGGRR